jgi:hypothetical protein
MSARAIVEVGLALVGLSLVPVCVNGEKVDSKEVLPSYERDIGLPNLPN